MKFHLRFRACDSFAILLALLHSSDSLAMALVIQSK